MTIRSRGERWLWQASHEFASRNRERKARFAVEFGQRWGVGSVLIVGVEPHRDAAPAHTPSMNVVERCIEAAFSRVVASGLEEHGTGWIEYQQADALNLPFEDNEFDLVYSNAVIEHVGQEAEQARFVQEHERVGREWVFTTPNRLFPIEAHTMTVAKHMKPTWRPSQLPPPYTRLLSKGDLRRILPTGAVIHGSSISPTFTVSST